MFEIFICEDEKCLREKYEQIIQAYLVQKKLNAVIRLSTADPFDILDHLQEGPIPTAIYFLDIDLGKTMTGMELAQKIRAADPLSKLIFITTHGEQSPLTFEYKLEALDFIIKDDAEKLPQRIVDCLQIAITRQSEQTVTKRFQIPNRSIDTFVDYHDILIFQTSAKPHVVELYTRYGKLEFYGKMKEIEKTADEFIRVHKSYIVNYNNIKFIDRHVNELEMINGQRCLITPKKRKLLKQLQIIEKPD